MPRKERGQKDSARSWMKWKRDTTRNYDGTMAEQKQILNIIRISHGRMHRNRFSLAHDDRAAEWVNVRIPRSQHDST